MPSRPSLSEYAGGAAAFSVLARAHHVRGLADPELNHPFSHPDQHPEHVERLAAYWAEVMGGPPTYSRDCADHSWVLHLHAGNGGLGDLPDRFLACFLAAMDDAGLPTDAAFRSTVRAYMESALAEVLDYQDPATPVDPGRPVPRWTWDGPSTTE